MTALAEGARSLEPSGIIAEAYGFVPNLFRLQAELPAALEAESGLIDAILLKGVGFGGANKHPVLAAVAIANCNDYLFALSHQGSVNRDNPSCLDFATKLARSGACISKEDVDLIRSGLNESTVLEIISTVALGNMLCTLDRALEPKLDACAQIEMPGWKPVSDPVFNSVLGPHLQFPAGISNDLATFFRDQYGFVPGLFRSQASWPDLLAAEAMALDLIVFSEEHLSRVQKESILLVVSARNLSTYGTALHGQVLRTLGLSVDTVDAIVDDLPTSALASNDKVLLTEASYLAGLPNSNFDPKALANCGFSQKQVLEAVATAGLGNFLNTLQFGLGTPPDFPPRRVFGEKDLYRAIEHSRLTSEAVVRDDPDAEVVARVRRGDTEAFEELVRRHMRRIFGILNGMLGNYDEAHEATQEVLVKAFEHVGRFEGRSKFSTWLTSIAVNTGTEMLRQRKPVVALDEATEEDFRPRRVMAWAEDPEKQFATAQMKALVRDAVLRLPQKYRVAVLLRDINQLATEDAADALGLSVPALKARVLRGRLMLRESLAAHFLPSENEHA